MARYTNKLSNFGNYRQKFSILALICQNPDSKSQDYIFQARD
jgi:hypothetical protein